MKKQNTIIVIIIILALIIDIVIVYKFQSNHKNKVDKQDENELYSEKFDHTILKFQRFDYTLGQNMIVGVEKSTDGGKTFSIITQDGVVVSNKARFDFFDENVAFIISRELIDRNNNFSGLKVSQDGGKTFVDAKFSYDNDRVDILHIDNFPYYNDKKKLSLECTIYDIAPDGNGYTDYIITFVSEDNGLTWK